MEKESVQKGKSKIEDKSKNEVDEKLVNIGKLVGRLETNRLLRAMSDIKKQNAQLFDAIRSIQPHDKHLELKIKNLYQIAANLRTNTEREMANLERFLRDIEDNKVDEKFLERIATINKPNRESIKYGQSLVSLRKSFLNMAVKRASEKTRKEASGNDRGGE